MSFSAEVTGGLPEGQKFDVKKETFPYFAKIIRHLLVDCSLEEIMKVAVKWNNATNTKDPSELINTSVKNGTS
eukprot:9911970-Ditylum_brightwellii.AAC.1